MNAAAGTTSLAAKAEVHPSEGGVLAHFYQHAAKREAVGISGMASLQVMAPCSATCRSSLYGETVTLAAPAG